MRIGRAATSPLCREKSVLTRNPLSGVLAGVIIEDAHVRAESSFKECSLKLDVGQLMPQSWSDNLVTFGTGIQNAAIMMLA